MASIKMRRLKSVDSLTRRLIAANPHCFVVSVTTAAIGLIILYSTLGTTFRNGEAKIPPRITPSVSISLEERPDAMQPLIRGQPGTCLKHVLYDKPVKTGSTAIMLAIRNYLNEDGRFDKACSDISGISCKHLSQRICNGTYETKDYFSIIGHFQYAERQLVECLRPHYYVVTSIRDPYQRRKSAYLWNRTLNETHFGISHTVSFAEFMERLPRCQLYHYYDGRGMTCDAGGLTAEERVQEIVDRTDEVIDLYDEQPAGPLHTLILKFLTRENESIKISEDQYVEHFDKDTLKEEQILYDRLREKRMRTPDSNRLPC